MDTLSFYSLLIQSADKESSKKFDSLQRKFKNVEFKNDEIAHLKIKSEIASSFGFAVINSPTSLMIEETENLNFAYCLKVFGLYPVKGDDFSYWNEHVHLLTELERNGFLEKDTIELQRFLKENFNFGDKQDKIISPQMLSHQGVNILLILLHLDHLISRKWRIKSIPLNQAMQFKYKKNKSYYPAKSFSDFLLFILDTNEKCGDSKSRRHFFPSRILFIQKFEDWLGFLPDQEKAKARKQLIKKMRENKRFCYLNEVYDFLEMPHGEFKNDEIYDRVSEENYLFIKNNELPKEGWYESIDAIAALWLIYFWQDYYFKHAKEKGADSISVLAKSEELGEIWNAFLTKYPSEGQYIWPSELMHMDK